jgi:phosphoribosylformylglycinamidine synthase
MFGEFFARENSFSLGVCNGCQMLSTLRDIIPGADAWPRFVRNESEQFEARFSQLEILETPSIFFAGMSGSVLPIAVAHGEGRADFGDTDPNTALVAARYVDGYGEVATRYPQNPNGSPLGITALTTPDGRATIMMPHPERVFRTVTNSWHPADWDEDGPWLRMFRNARVWTG